MHCTGAAVEGEGGEKTITFTVTLTLKFVWERNTLPSRDEDFTKKFSIHLMMRNECEADRMFPRKLIITSLRKNLLKKYDHTVDRALHFS
jgi:hypothetical protein